MEQVLRALDNDDIGCEDVNELKEMLDYYLENMMSEECFDDEVYDPLNLDTASARAAEVEEASSRKIKHAEREAAKAAKAAKEAAESLEKEEKAAKEKRKKERSEKRKKEREAKEAAKLERKKVEAERKAKKAAAKAGGVPAAKSGAGPAPGPAPAPAPQPLSFAERLKSKGSLGASQGGAAQQQQQREQQVRAQQQQQRQQLIQQQQAQAQQQQAQQQAQARDARDDAARNLALRQQQAQQQQAQQRRDVATAQQQAQAGRGGGASMPPQPPPPPAAAHIVAQLEQSFKCLPQACDERDHSYAPRRPWRTPPSFPSTPLQMFNSPAAFEKLETDTLFYPFYHQQGTHHQYLAALKLRKESWRFHRKCVDSHGAAALRSFSPKRGPSSSSSPSLAHTPPTRSRSPGRPILLSSLSSPHRPGS
jgi:CCR4-NOT transcription complex subunit 3